MNKFLLSAAALVAVMCSYCAQAREIDHQLTGSPRADGWRPRLLLREQRPERPGRRPPVLYVHGSTFPSALSIMFRLKGRSWADALNASGFDVFGLDFAGYGGSERYPPDPAPRGHADEAADQINRAVHFIMKQTGAQRVSIVAHSWGTIAAGRFAGQHPELVDKLVLFGPIAQRSGPPSDEVIPPDNLVTNEAQHARFIGSVPSGERGVLVEEDFPRWASAYLDSDPDSRIRTPPSVKVPTGPDADLAAAWSGQLPYDPAAVRAPTLIVRGAWDPITTDADVFWLRSALRNAAEVRDVKVPRATHLMHLEQGRIDLYAAVDAFLRSTAAAPAVTASKTIDQQSLFAVVFEVQPDPTRRADYLRIAGDLRPELVTMPGFLMNERYRSRSRPGALLSLSLWDNEKALIRWRTVEQHHAGQAEGRAGVLSDYHLRVGEVTAGSGAYTDRRLSWMTNDQTAVSSAKGLTVVDGAEVGRADGALHCEIFDHLLIPRRVATLCEWPTRQSAEAYVAALKRTVTGSANIYAIQVVRDYGMTDRREAPQFLR